MANTVESLSGWTLAATVNFGSVPASGTQAEFYSLPAKGVVEAVMVELMTQFTNSTAPPITLDVGNVGSPTLWATAFNLAQAVGNASFNLSSTIHMSGLTTAESLKYRANYGGSLTAGQFRIWLKVGVVPDGSTFSV